MFFKNEQIDNFTSDITLVKVEIGIRNDFCKY